MKKDCAKIKAMKVRKFHKPEVFKRLNRKVVGIFSIALILIVTAGIMGVILSNNASAGRQNKAATAWNWNYERVLHFSNYKITIAGYSKSEPVENEYTIDRGCNGSGGGGLMVYGDGDFNNPTAKPTYAKNWCYALGGPVNGELISSMIENGTLNNDTNPNISKNGKGKYFVQNWNPIDAEYAPGYIDLGTAPIYKKEVVNGKERLVLNEYSGLPLTTGIRWIDSAHIYFPAETEPNKRESGNAARSRKEIAKDALKGVTSSYALSWCSPRAGGYNVKDGKVGRYDCYFPYGANEKNEFNYVDQIKGASYLGQLYDIRKYTWSGAMQGGGTNCHAQARIGSGGERLFGSNIRSCGAVTMFEFHFYPNGTLERLDDELMFQNIQVEFWHDENGDPYVYKTGKRAGEPYSVVRNVPVYVHRPKLVRYTAANKPTRMVIDQNDATNWTYFSDCLYDFIRCIKDADENGSVAAYKNTHLYTEDEYNDIITRCDTYLTTAYQRKETINRDIVCTREDYQAWLYKQEKSVGIVERKGDQYEYSYGVFKGFMLGDDIDGGSPNPRAEGYQIVQGLHKAWLPISTNLQINPQQRFINKGTWLNACKSKANYENDGCYQAWMGTTNCSAGVITCMFYFAFRSTADEPLQVAYFSTGHVSNMSSSNFPVAFVITGDISDELQIVFDEIKQKYKDMYGKDILQEKIVKENGLNDGWEVMYLFNTTQYSYFNPYTINRVLAEQYPDIAKQLNIWWYASPEDYRNDKVIPDDEANPTAITGPTVFYGSFDRTIPGEFPATCVSNNDEYIDTSNRPLDLTEDN